MIAAVEDLGWQDFANCLGIDPDWFFPPKGYDSRATVEAAKAVCAGCAVRAECLEYALARNERFGVWGGMTRTERRQHATRQARVA